MPPTMSQKKEDIQASLAIWEAKMKDAEEDWEKERLKMGDACEQDNNAFQYKKTKIENEISTLQARLKLLKSKREAQVEKQVKIMDMKEMNYRNYCSGIQEQIDADKKALAELEKCRITQH